MKELETKSVETPIKSVAKRPKRVPLGHRGRMEVPSIPGYYMRYINTDQERHGSRMHEARLAGYEPVLRKEVFGADCDDPDAVVTASDPLKPVLVKLPMEYREEDLARKAKVNEDMVKAKADGGHLEVSRSSH